MTTFRRFSHAPLAPHGSATTLAVVFVTLVVLAAGAGGALALPPRLQAGLDAINPIKMGHTVTQNYRDGRFYATDLTEHPTIGQALARSVQPVDMSANVKAAFLSRVHPVKLVGALADPLMIELQREVASGQGIQPRKLLGALNPTVIAATFAGGLAGDLAGAALQSALAGLGPVGAAAGLLLRPTISFAASMFGYSVGAGMGNQHLSFKQAVAQALRQIEPGRDTGQLLGGTAGAILGQVLIPIPIVGSIVGATIGGTLGAAIGQYLGHHGPTGKVSRWLKGVLNRWADKLDGGGAKTAGAGDPSGPGTSSNREPSGSDAPTGGPSPFPLPPPAITPSPSPGPSPALVLPPLVQPRPVTIAPFDPGPGWNDLPTVSR